MKKDLRELFLEACADTWRRGVDEVEATFVRSFGEAEGDKQTLAKAQQELMRDIEHALKAIEAGK